MSDQSYEPALPPSPSPSAASAPADTRPAGGARVLVVDDEPEIRRAVQTGLAGAAFEVAWAPTAAAGIEQVARWHPDVVILDLALPDLDGLEVVRRLRGWSRVPIIVLSVRGADADKISALELGADDYLTKPFSMGELLARIRVALRHASQAGGSGNEAGSARFVTGDLTLDFERRVVTMAGAEVHLTPTEYEVLKYLALNAGKVITHRTLLRAVWGPQYADEAHYLRVFVGQLRRKLEPDPSRPRYLLTEPGIGYRLRSSEAAVLAPDPAPAGE
jgi:two-component system, OmpR family, KDP operon response regulator KdpE